MHYRNYFVAILLFSLFIQKVSAQDLTAVIGAMPQEIAAYDGMIENRHEVNVGGIQFIKGYIKKRNVVFVVSGIGKVNAAMTCTMLLQHFKPSRVLFTGVAGSIDQDIHIGDIVIADSVVQHDFGTLTDGNAFQYWGAQNPIDQSKNPVFFKADSLLLSTAKLQSASIMLEPIVIQQLSRAPVITNGIVATGDQFISSVQKKLELKKTLHAQAVEMEGGAVAQVCHQQKVPFLIIRSISDLAGSDAEVNFSQFLQIASKNAAKFVGCIIEALPKASHQQAKDYYKTELYFGMSYDGKTVTEQQWQQFLSRYITPKFPDGLTVIDGYGQWYSEKQKRIVRERSKVVVIYHQDDPGFETSIQFITGSYCKQFHQESVMRVDSKTEKVTF
ncbi:5'-methylthioadenosine/adenosylhomocysteine nucleosidase [Chitinophagaceae bacterium LB-8]|uniref:adenosylhomocysteine nucleosidase n=1 Tax=Paraflavisolibacter caeni TaxID=2982496 RepID=A0A9X2XYK2_9BACT|nr:5'-methylthioadenosine/adenosylhomocysteine nucleosidase [Paraflavisolibacter caeni]MCU7549978.1 5'-methylthioadenosine/adenosylhomocysteine nucleosidase [Paraflavisolibacter caeni]